MTVIAERIDTACSPDAPPNTTPMRTGEEGMVRPFIQEANLKGIS